MQFIQRPCNIQQAANNRIEYTLQSAFIINENTRVSRGLSVPVHI